MPAVNMTNAGLLLEQVGVQVPMVYRKATGTGATTGTIADNGGLQVVFISNTTDANDIIVLPTPTPGTILVLCNGATGYNLQSSAPATVGINGGSGAGVKSAIPASTTCLMICETATAWKGLQMSATAGTLAKVTAAS